MLVWCIFGAVELLWGYTSSLPSGVAAGADIILNCLEKLRTKVLLLFYVAS